LKKKIGKDIDTSIFSSVFFFFLATFIGKVDHSKRETEKKNRREKLAKLKTLTMTYKSSNVILLDTLHVDSVDGQKVVAEIQHFKALLLA
jgi:hypothetical protein